MDATQAIDWGVGDEAADDQAHAIEVGSLSVSHPDGTAELHRLYTGQNIVARRGSERQKDDERLERWREQYNARDTMNGIFVESSSISSPHAIIYLENGGELNFVKDLGSKNKTMLEVPGKRRQVLQSGDRWSFSSGDALIFGNARCQVDINPAAARADQGPSMGTVAEGQGAGTLNQDDTQAYMSFGEAIEEGGGLEGAEGAAAAEAAAEANNAAAAAAAAASQEAAGRSGAAAEQATLVEPTQVEMQQATQQQTSPHPDPVAGVPAVAAVGGPSSQSPTRVMGGPELAEAEGPSRSPTRGMGRPNLAAAGGPSRSPTRRMGGADVAAAGGPSRSPTRSRTTRDGNLGDDYDEGDSIWLPPLTGALASQQEVMSPPKEDALPARLAATAAAPAMPAAPGPTQLPIEPFHAMPHPDMQETQLAEPSLGQEFPTQDAQGALPAAAAIAAVRGTPALGGATQAEPSGGSGGGSGLSLRPILPASADPGTPRIGAAPQEDTMVLEPDSEEGTLQIAPSRRPGRKARILADTQDTLGRTSEPVAAPEEAMGAASPQEATDPADQVTDAAAPEQETDTAAPEQAIEAAVPEQATEDAAPEQARGAGASRQAAETADPVHAMEAAAPEQASSMAVAAQIGPGGWRIKKKPAPPAQDAPADTPSPTAQHGSGQSVQPEEGAGGDVDFKAHVEKKTILSPRQEYVPPAQQAQLQASSSGWKRKGVSSSQNPSQSSEPLPVLPPASPPTAAAAVATATPPSQEWGPSLAEGPPEPQQAAAPDQAGPILHHLHCLIAAAAVEERSPARPLWQDLLSDILPAENTGAAEVDAQLDSAEASGVAEQQHVPVTESHMPSTQDVSAAIINVGDLADCFVDSEAPAGRAPLNTAGTPATARKGARRLPASVRAAGQATIPEQPGPDTAALAIPNPITEAAGVEDTEQGEASGDGAQAAPAEEGVLRPRSGRSRAPSARGRGCGRRSAAAAAAEAAPDQAASVVEALPDQAASAETVPDQAAAAVEAAPDEAGTATATPDQAPAAAEAAPDQAAAEAAPEDEASPAEAGPKEGAVPAGSGAPEEAAAGKAAPKRGRSKAAKVSAAAASQPGPGNAAAAPAPSTEAADLFSAELDEPAKEARPSSSVQKVFSRRGRRSSAAAAAEEVAAGAEEAAPAADLEVAPEKKQGREAPRGRGKKADTAAEQDSVDEAHAGQAAVADTKKPTAAGKAASSKVGTGGLTESQTAAQTLAQVRAAHGQAPRVSPVPEEAAPAPTCKARGRVTRAKPPAAKRDRASRAKSAAPAEKDPEETAAEEGPKEAAAEQEPQQPAAEKGPAGPRSKKRGHGKRQDAHDVAAEVTGDVAGDVAKPAPPAKRGRRSAAAAAKHSEGDELQEPATAGDDKKEAALGRRGRTLARKEEAQAAVAAHAEAPPVPATRRGRASAAAAAAAEGPLAEEAAAQPPASRKRGSKKPPVSEAAAAAEAPAEAHTEEENFAHATEAPSRKRGRQSQSQAPSEAADKATEALAASKGRGRAARPGPAGTSAAAAEVEAIQDPAPAPKRSHKTTAGKGSQGQEAVTAQDPQLAKRGRETSVTANEAEAAQETAPAPKRSRKSAKESQAQDAVTGRESQPEGTPAAGGAAGPAPKRGGRKSAGAAVATGAASQSAEAGLSMQLRATEAKPPRVLISTCVDAKLRQSITKTIERLGGTITASAQDFTVFVTLDASGRDKDRGFTKSLNALSALASGSHIVSEKWVDACARSDAFVSAKEFLLKDPAAEKKFGFSLAATFEAAQQALLLEGVHVFLTPGLVAAEADKGEGLRMLVQRAGGNVAETMPKKLPTSGAQWLLLGDEKSKAKEAAWAKKALNKKGVKLHGRSALINGLMTQRLDREADVLLEM